MNTNKPHLGAALLLISVPAVTLAVPDFTYVYSNPYSATADDYIESVVNAHRYEEGTVRAWIPVTGGATKETTSPGVITYKFDFGSETVSEANLRTNNPTFHWSYSRGYNYFYGSKDGATWTELLEVPTPAFGGANSGWFNDVLPDSLLGGSELWFKVELYSFGPSVTCCGVYGRNTAQHSRFDTGYPSAETFKLEVTYADDTSPVDPVPEPATLALMGLGLAGIGYRRYLSKKAA